MLPDYSDVLKCPFCGGEKEVMALMSGNTCGGQSWSDVKTDYPMLPRVSPIQKCPICGKYYFTKEADRRKSENYVFEKGDLTYEQLKEAAIQFGDVLSEPDKIILNVLLLWAYNDNYNREDVGLTVAPEDEKKYVRAVLDELIASEGTDEIVRAEYLRERGRFDEALAILDKCCPEEDYLRGIVERMKTYAKEKNTIAFKI